ncbi:MAG: LON peptidase substrate-binding domain-containing protein, partial [Nitrospinota bacterium]|nr:LON peptidase substrate-binding domain-containing protein [Nitrospinota bacterium]
MNKDNIDDSVWSLPLPLLPLRDLVVLPGSSAPLLVGRPKSIAAVEAAYAQDLPIMLASQRNSRLNDPGEDDINRLGCLARISNPRAWPDGTLQVTVEGL